MPNYPCIFHVHSTVSYYQKLRVIPDAVKKQYCIYMIRQLDQTRPVNILEAGSGSGRFIIPLVQVLKESSLQYNLTACDVSEQMLEQLSTRIDCRKNFIEPILFDLQSKHVIGEDIFDLIFTIAVLHIPSDWRQCLRNMMQMLRPGGICILTKEINQFMHRTEGFDNSGDLEDIDAQLDEFFRAYHQFRIEAGEPYLPTGITYSDIKPAIDYLVGRGMEPVETRLDDEGLKWQKPHSYTDLLETFRLRTITTWGSDLSPAARAMIYDQLKDWLIKRRIDMETTFYLPAKLQTFTFRKPC